LHRQHELLGHGRLQRRQRNLTYTAGATTGYNIKANKTTDYLRSRGSGGPYMGTGGAVGSTADFWQIFGSARALSSRATALGSMRAPRHGLDRQRHRWSTPR